MTEGNTNAETLFCDYYEQWIIAYTRKVQFVK